MNKTYLFLALCFRWFMLGMFTFIIVLPALVTLTTDI
jgi:hypothetical protein